MPFSTVLIANRGEVALRVSRAAAGLGMRTVGVYTQDDRDSLHVSRCDEAVSLPGTGAAGYLDIPAVIQAALDTGADAVHPGYGLLSENRAFALACAEAGVAFIGPEAGALGLFGDKGRARRLAADNGVPTLAGTAAATSLGEMQAFFHEAGDGPVLIKALHGGGGRGMRVVRNRAVLADAYEQCRREAEASFGSGELYIERLLERARHIEVQVIGDGTGQAVHLWDRDCSVQRRHQKLIEIAPCQRLDSRLRSQVLAAAVSLARAVRYRGLLTVELLVGADGDFYFMEGNPRLQVEHTVTEEILGLDLVQAQIQVCGGARLSDLGLTPDLVPEPRGVAIQIRVNAETVDETGAVLPSGGRISGFTMPGGHGARVDTAAYDGYRVNPRFDSLVAKVIAHARGFDEARKLALRLLAETRVGGVPTNLALQMAILESPAFGEARYTTSSVDEHKTELIAAAREKAAAAAAVSDQDLPHTPAAETVAPVPEGAQSVTAPVSGIVVAVEIGEGDEVAAGRTLVVLEAMKMHYTIAAPVNGVVARLLVKEGDVVHADAPLLHLRPGAGAASASAVADAVDLDTVPEKLAEVRDRKALLLDTARLEAVQWRAGQGMRTARQNIADLADPGTFVEYGGLAVAAQRTRRDLDDLIIRTPADGIVTGTATVNGARFGPDRTTCVVLAYDYTVLAGTQGYWNHAKTDRVLEVARRHQYPVVLFAEGGGGRPGDVDVPKVAALNTRSFSALSGLSGLVPTVGIAAGRCFAGNAALLGVCDVIIATRNSNIGMGGPAMIEGGGLGVYRPEDIGPIGVQTANGVVDIAVADEEDAVATAKRYLAYFQGDLTGWEEHDQRRLRHVVPADRKRVYDVRQAIELIFDIGSVLELRPGFGAAIVTALARLAGRTVGVVANNPLVLGGAIDAPGADKMARFLQLCDVFGLPVVSLCDTPGFMVGPRSEETATVRHFARLFLRGAGMTVPLAMVVLRKAYGLGAMAMGAGCTDTPFLTVSWPDGEFGGMGLEGAVRLGFRDELQAIADPDARQSRYDELVAAMYERGKALNTAMHLELDDVIDPADTRSLLRAALPPVPRRGWINEHLRPGLDAW